MNFNLENKNYAIGILRLYFKTDIPFQKTDILSGHSVLVLSLVVRIDRPTGNR